VQLLQEVLVREDHHSLASVRLEKVFQEPPGPLVHLLEGFSTGGFKE
jgi:hypothetical protein